MAPASDARCDACSCLHVGRSGVASRQRTRQRTHAAALCGAPLRRLRVAHAAQLARCEAAELGARRALRRPVVNHQRLQARRRPLRRRRRVRAALLLRQRQVGRRRRHCRLRPSSLRSRERAGRVRLLRLHGGVVRGGLGALHARLHGAHLLSAGVPGNLLALLLPLAVQEVVVLARERAQAGGARLARVGRLDVRRGCRRPRRSLGALCRLRVAHAPRLLRRGAHALRLQLHRVRVHGDALLLLAPAARGASGEGCAFTTAARRSGTDRSRSRSCPAFAAFSLICDSSAALSTTCVCAKGAARPVNEGFPTARCSAVPARAAHRQRRVDGVQARVHVGAPQAALERRVYVAVVHPVGGPTAHARGCRLRYRCRAATVAWEERGHWAAPLYRLNDVSTHGAVTNARSCD